MKKLLIIALTIFALQASAQIQQVTLQASGLTCAMCSNAINKALQKLSFVATVKPNIKESSYQITFRDANNVDFDALKKAVEDAGFSVAKLQVKANFAAVKVNNDTHVSEFGKNLHFLHVKPQTLSGEQTFQIVDRKFLSDKDYKLYAAETRMNCVKTGYMQSCCSLKAASGSNRIYHVTI